MIKECKYCGKRFNARRDSIKFCSHKCASKNKVYDLRKKRFGNWVVMDKEPRKSKKGYFWLCHCKCGREKYVCGNDLRKGISKSCGCLNRLPPGESDLNWLFNYYRKISADKRGHAWELSKEEFRKLIKKDCYYCGNKPLNLLDRRTRKRNGKIYKNNSNGTLLYNGVDRKDNFKGYTKTNVVPCCKICNGMKSKMGEKEFLKQIKKIHNFKKL